MWGRRSSTGGRSQDGGDGGGNLRTVAGAKSPVVVSHGAATAGSRERCGGKSVGRRVKKVVVGLMQVNEAPRAWVGEAVALESGSDAIQPLASELLRFM